MAEVEDVLLKIFVAIGEQLGCGAGFERGEVLEDLILRRYDAVDREQLCGRGEDGAFSLEDDGVAAVRRCGCRLRTLRDGDGLFGPFAQKEGERRARRDGGQKLDADHFEEGDVVLQGRVVESADDSFEQLCENSEQRRARAGLLVGVPFRRVDGGQRARLLKDGVAVPTVNLGRCQRHLRLLLQVERED